MDNATDLLVKFVMDSAQQRISTAADTVARQSLLDWYAVTLAGVDEELPQILRAQFAPTAGDGSACGTTILGTRYRASQRDAALINGTTSHVLDYDNSTRVSGIHPTAVILPGLFALAQCEGGTVGNLLRAYVIGCDVAVFIASMVQPIHISLGFHSTATIGTFAAAAACGVLVGLSEEQMTSALGIAAIQAAGLTGAFGSMGKPYQVGVAAMNGLVAAQLARDGFRSNQETIAGVGGFAHSHTGGSYAAPSIPTTGEGIADSIFKFHAACHGTHSSADCIRAICGLHKISAEQIDEIQLHLPAMYTRSCNIQRPTTGLQSKFSVRHVAALSALGEDTSLPGLFSDGNAVDHRITAMRERVTVHARPAPEEMTYAQIKTHEGRVYEQRSESLARTPDLLEQNHKIREKFCKLVSNSPVEKKAFYFADMVEKVEYNDNMGELIS